MRSLSHWFPSSGVGIQLLFLVTFNRGKRPNDQIPYEWGVEYFQLLPFIVCAKCIFGFVGFAFKVYVVEMQQTPGTVYDVLYIQEQKRIND